MCICSKKIGRIPTRQSSEPLIEGQHMNYYLLTPQPLNHLLALAQLLTGEQTAWAENLANYQYQKKKRKGNMLRANWLSKPLKIEIAIRNESKKCLRN